MDRWVVAPQVHSALWYFFFFVYFRSVFCVCVPLGSLSGANTAVPNGLVLSRLVQRCV